MFFDLGFGFGVLAFLLIMLFSASIRVLREYPGRRGDYSIARFQGGTGDLNRPYMDDRKSKA